MVAQVNRSTMHPVQIVQGVSNAPRAYRSIVQWFDCINNLVATDPCCGSGHILSYLFDVLVQIYEAHGVQTRDAVKSIVEHNLYGLDIDDRAAHLGSRAFDEIGGEVVQTTSFVMRNSSIKEYKGIYYRLLEPTTQQGKEQMFLERKSYYYARQKDFCKIPGKPVAYWVAETVFKIMTGTKLGEYFVSGGQFKSCNDELFLRFWWETIADDSDWHCYCKGGDSRKYIENEIRIINWTKECQEYYKKNGGVGNKEYWEKDGITWTTITTSTPSFRIKTSEYFWSSSAPTIFSKLDRPLETVIAYLNSKPVEYFLGILNPTTSLTVADVLKLPYSKDWETDRSIELCKCNKNISRKDWGSFENSKNFCQHPLICKTLTIQEAYKNWKTECDSRFNQIKQNEEELNRIFIDIYGLQDELTPEIQDKDITARKAELSRDIRSFISYAVGCMFGRYSLDQEGLIYAGGEWNLEQYKIFPADKDNIIPICDDEYFEDDIVGLFIQFVKTVYGEETLEENLKFIADALGGKESPKEVIRNYVIKDFYKDHCKTYQKRPIYWLFDSGKKNGFKALIYMHRYQPDTIARIRTDYVHQQQSRYRTSLEDLERRMEDADTRERVKLNKKLKILKNQMDEIHEYEEKIHHLADQMISIDLDDGVKKNYAKFQEVLAKIK